MHDGCNGRFDNGAMTVNKLRQMGFSGYPMPEATEITCSYCGEVFIMKTMEDRCTDCGMVYGVTPCHASDPASILPAGIDY